MSVTDAPDFVKIDVEGATACSRPAARSRRADASGDLCEIVGRHPPGDELAAFDRLAGLGYVTVGVDGEPVDVRRLTGTTDVLFVPVPGA